MNTLATSWIHTNKGWIRSDQILLVRAASEWRNDRMSHIVKLRAPSVSAFDTEMPDDYPTLDAAQAAAAKLVTAIATGRKGTDR